MGDPTAAFFEGLRRRDYQPALARKSGIVRLDIDDNGRNERWFVTIDDGNVKVSKRSRRADATVRVERDLFDRIVSGRANAMTALLRGAVQVEGDWNLLVVFQRLFPAPQ